MSNNSTSIIVQSLQSEIRKQDINSCRALLDKLQDVNVTVKDQGAGGTLLHFACSTGNVEIVQDIIDRGAKLNTKDEDGWSAIFHASNKGHLDVVQLLLVREAEKDWRDENGWSALSWSVYEGHGEVTATLIHHGWDVNCIGSFHSTPLMWAAGRGHVAIVKLLLHNGARVDICDKFGNSPLLWACRKGQEDCAKALLEWRANIDVAGANARTPLIVATMQNHVACLTLLLKHKPNLNAVDKDGHTALCIAAKAGSAGICAKLIEAGAYVNVNDTHGDSILILACKSGNVSIVKALIEKHADVNATGEDDKTPLMWACVRGEAGVVDALLRSGKQSVSTEVRSASGDTALLHAVRNKHADCVELLLHRGKAKVSALDKLGNSALHLAMKAHSKRMVEVLLRDPKNSKLLYKPNRAGETPYNLDAAHEKPILTSILGTRQLNASEDEDVMGYELYSGALADILSEPSLCLPIVVGLYAKWGSGKSILLYRLQQEMQNFAEWIIEPNSFSNSWLLIIIVFMLLLPLAIITSILTRIYLLSLLFIIILITVVMVLVILNYLLTHTESRQALRLSLSLSRVVSSVKLLLKVTFCRPPLASSAGSPCIASAGAAAGVATTSNELTSAADMASDMNDARAGREQAKQLRFIFSDYQKLTTVGGEKSIAAMVASLYRAIEAEFGWLTSRMCLALMPNQYNESDVGGGYWRTVCCIPVIVIVIVTYSIGLVGITLLALLQWQQFSDSDGIKAALYTIAAVIALIIIGNIYQWCYIMRTLVYSQYREVNRLAFRVDNIQMEGIMHTLKRVIQRTANLVQCIDAFSDTDTRLVIIIDGLDSAEQDRVIQVLDAVNLLFTDPGSPFITLMSIDPHIATRALEASAKMTTVFSDTSITGYDYLRNLVQLPFFLQTQPLLSKDHAHITHGGGYEGTAAASDSGRRTGTASHLISRRDSSKLFLRRQVSLRERAVSGCSGEQLHRAGSRGSVSSVGVVRHAASNLDVSKLLLTNVYYSDVNPRTLRRLINIVYITGRLLRAFSVDFAWAKLTAWVNVVEQWPTRSTHAILHYERHKQRFDDATTLKVVYEAAKEEMPPGSGEVAHLLELDRSPQKLEASLTRAPVLTVADVRLFLPFSCNMDPYIRKVLQETWYDGCDRAAAVPHRRPSNVSTPDIAAYSCSGVQIGLSAGGYPKCQSSVGPSSPVELSLASPLPPAGDMLPGAVSPATYYPPPLHHQHTNQLNSIYPAQQQYYPPGSPPHMYDPNCIRQYAMVLPSSSNTHGYPQPTAPDYKVTSSKKLSNMSIYDVITLLSEQPGVQRDHFTVYAQTFEQNNINGTVLKFCDLGELKGVTGMTFGDWEIFRLMILSLRHQEYQLGLTLSAGSSRPSSSLGVDLEGSNVKVTSPHKSNSLSPHLQTDSIMAVCSRNNTTKLSTSLSPTISSIPTPQANNNSQKSVKLPPSKRLPAKVTTSSGRNLLTVPEEAGDTSRSRSMEREVDMETSILLRAMDKLPSCDVGDDEEDDYSSDAGDVQESANVSPEISTGQHRDNRIEVKFDNDDTSVLSAAEVTSHSSEAYNISSAQDVWTYSKQMPGSLNGSQECVELLSVLNTSESRPVGIMQSDVTVDIENNEEDVRMPLITQPLVSPRMLNTPHKCITPQTRQEMEEHLTVV